MIKLHRAGFASGAIHRNEISHTLLNIEDHLTVLAVFTTVVVASHLLKCIPAAARTHLVNGQHRVEITIFRGQLGRALLRGGEGRPCRGATGVAGVVWFSRILGGSGGIVNCRSGERKFARLFLYLPQLGNQARQQVRPTKDNFDFLVPGIATNWPGRKE